MPENNDMRIDLLIEEGLITRDEDDPELYHITLEGWATAFLDLLMDYKGLDDLKEATEIAYEDGFMRLLIHVAEDLLHSDMDHFLEEFGGETGE